MNQNTIYGIILAAGDGTRMKAEDKNKTALKFNDKPMIAYGVDTLDKVTSKVFVVVGAHQDSIKMALSDKRVIYVDQEKRLGTGHAAQIAIKHLVANNDFPNLVLIGYGDHMMFIKPTTVKNMIQKHQATSAAVTLLTTHHQEADSLAWGRIIRDKQGFVKQIVEQKDAAKSQRLIQEINPGFYCFNFNFISNNISKLKPSKVTGEYYLTDMIELARAAKLPVCPFAVGFEEVGIGVNTPQQLNQSQDLHRSFKKIK